MSNTPNNLMDGDFANLVYMDPELQSAGVHFEDPVTGFECVVRHEDAPEVTKYFRKCAMPFAATIGNNREAAAELNDRLSLKTLAYVGILSWKPFPGPDGAMVECPSDEAGRQAAALKWLGDRRFALQRAYVEGCQKDSTAFRIEPITDPSGAENLAHGSAGG